MMVFEVIVPYRVNLSWKKWKWSTKGNISS